MPNLEHDPQNPSDLLGRPIKPGDIVAWATTIGKSPAMAVARIDSIRWTRQDPFKRKNVECPQLVAEDYQLRLSLIKTTRLGQSIVNRVTGETRWGWDRLTDDDCRDEWAVKPSLIKLVKNVVKLEPYDSA